MTKELAHELATSAVFVSVPSADAFLGGGVEIGGGLPNSVMADRKHSVCNLLSPIQVVTRESSVLSMGTKPWFQGQLNRYGSAPVGVGAKRTGVAAGVPPRGGPV